MFSKALFKQSCKANGTMWAVITFAVCFMLACVMLISGSGNIGATKNAIQDTIIRKEIEAQLETRAINYYGYQVDGMETFDGYFAANASQALVYHAKFAAWLQAPDASERPAASSATELLYLKNFSEWNAKKPVASDYPDDNAYKAALDKWQAASPVTQQGAVAAAYTVSAMQLAAYAQEKAAAIDPAYTPDSVEAQEILGVTVYPVNPDAVFDDEFYQNAGETKPDAYDVSPILSHIATNDVNEFLAGERKAYVAARAETLSSIFLAGNITKDENVEKIVKELAAFGVTKAKYDSFGYDYAAVKHLAASTVITYRNRLDYEKSELDKLLSNDEITSEEYDAKLKQADASLRGDIASSLLASLPKEVSTALEEVGKLDLYSLVVGSIFYKLAGLLLPIIFMIMASNNLIAGQVDSGSMAYVLSTSTKRKTVVFTQAVFLVGSLFAMFTLTTLTGVICLACVTEEVSLTYGNLVLLNLGAFFVLFALSGLCFFTSCHFDRSKRSMAVGGGLSIFSLVAAMLGLFGSPVIPQVVRLDALNNFNYVTVITLFDAISIIDGTTTFIWKFAILFALGIAGYIAGALRFTKKDLPL